MKSRFILFIFALCIHHSIYSQYNVSFTVRDVPDLSDNERIGIRGSQRPLSWSKSLFMTSSNEDWTVTIPFNSEINLVEYKYVLESPKNEETFWELDGYENRIAVVSRDAQVNDTWNVMSAFPLGQLPKISSENLLEDAEILGQAMWQIHPGIFKYNDSISFFKNLNQLQVYFSADRTYQEAYREISRFAGTLKCGHTYANFFNQIGLIKEIILEEPDKLPFGLTWIDRKMIITKNASGNPNLITGTEILSINGFSSSQIADSLLLLTKGDGDRNAKRFNSLEVSGYDYYEPFDVYFPLFFPPNEGWYELTVLLPGESETQTVLVASIGRKARYEALIKEGYQLPSSNEETWKFSKLNDKTALLQIGTFAVWDFELDWRKFLKDAFKTAREENIPNLIIDIRNNEGGLDAVLNVLQENLVREECSYVPFESKVRYDRVPEDLKPYLNTWNNSFYNLSGKVIPCGPDFYCEKNRKEGDPILIKKGKQPYKGKVWFLINAANSSSTFYLARIVKECNIGTLVGQETGGTKKGINGGGIFFLRLPNSKIEVDIPIFGSFAEGEPDEGIKPDIPVNRTKEDIVRGRDPELEAVLELIR